MSSIGVLFAITESTAERLLDAESDDEVGEIVEQLEDEWEAGLVVDLDKAWDSIHRALSDGTLDLDGGAQPLNLAILGGYQLYDGEGYVVSFVSRREVREVATALARIDEQEFARRYRELVPKDYAPEYGDEDLAYSWGKLQELQAFYVTAVKVGRAVVFTVDQ